MKLKFTLTPILFLFILLSNYNTKAQEVDSKKIMEEILKEKIRHHSFKNQLHELNNKNLNNSNDETKLSSDTGIEEGEPYIIVNPNNPDNIIASYMKFNPGTGLEFPIFYSNDGGQSWTQSVFDSQAIFSATPFSSSHPLIGGGGDPVFAFDNSGTLYFSWIYLAIDPVTFDGRFLLFWGSSTDGGATWTLSQGDDQFISQGGLDLLTNQTTNFGDGIFDRQWMDVDNSGGANNGNLYVSGFRVNTITSNIAISVRRKLAGNTNFEPNDVFVSPNPASVQFANLQVDSNGVVHVTYTDLNLQSIMHSFSTDGALTFSTPAAIGNVTFTQGNPNTIVDSRENPAVNFEIDNSTNNLYVTWTSFENGEAKAYIVSSTDGGLTWSTQQDIATLSATAPNQSYFSTVSADQDNVSISWYDLDINDVGHYMVMESQDGGSTWETPVQVSGDVTDFQAYSQEFFGDYFKTDRIGCKSYSIWSDGRSLSGPTVYVGIVDHCALSTEQVELFPNDSDLTVIGIYPNPIQDVLSIELDLKVSKLIHIEIVDTQGKLITSLVKDSISAGKYINTFNLSELASGSYLLTIESEKGKIVKRLLKK